MNVYLSILIIKISSQVGCYSYSLSFLHIQCPFSFKDYKLKNLTQFKCHMGYFFLLSSIHCERLHSFCYCEPNKWRWIVLYKYQYRTTTKNENANWRSENEVLAPIAKKWEFCEVSDAHNGWHFARIRG